MGVIDKAERAAQQEGPKCPSVFIPTYEKFRELKFAQRETEDKITIYPRDQISWHDIVAFKQISGHSVSILEAELIMGMDALFEGREDG